MIFSDTKVIRMTFFTESFDDINAAATPVSVPEAGSRKAALGR